MLSLTSGGMKHNNRRHCAERQSTRESTSSQSFPCRSASYHAFVHTPNTQRRSVLDHLSLSLFCQLPERHTNRAFRHPNAIMDSRASSYTQPMTGSKQRYADTAPQIIAVRRTRPSRPGTRVLDGFLPPSRQTRDASNTAAVGTRERVAGLGGVAGGCGIYFF